MAYSEKLLDHFKNPKNVGTLDKNKKSVGTGLVGAPECGDVMRLQIEVSDDGKIEDAKFKTFGCGSAIASSSLATEWLKGKSLDEASSIDNMDIVEELALPPVKIHCSVLAEDAIKMAIKDYRASRNRFRKRSQIRNHNFLMNWFCQSHIRNRGCDSDGISEKAFLKRSVFSITLEFVLSTKCGGNAVHSRVHRTTLQGVLNGKVQIHNIISVSLLFILLSIYA